MLWAAATDAGYTSPYWLTFKQARECGGNVRKGEKGALVVYANRMTRTTRNDKGDEVELTIPFLKGYVVFNAAQCENLPPHFTAPTGKTVAPLMDRCAAVDRFFAATRATIRHGGNRAYYAEKPDYIQMPPFESFCSRESYAATLAHEGVHWTKHESRLARDFGRKRWGDENYAREELVAEIGSAFLSADPGSAPDVRQDDASYIDPWIKVLKGDKRFIFTAASHAQRSVDYLHALQPRLPQEAPSQPAAA
jgi:antirestriction protein ArdC